MTQPKLVYSRDEQRAAEANAAFLSAFGGGPPDGDDMEDRIQNVERAVAKIDGQLDWAKIAATIISSVMIGGFAILITLMIFLFNRVDTLSTQTNAKIDKLSEKLADEFRQQRQELNAQVSTIANAITATKQTPAPPAPTTPPPTTPPKQP